MPKYFVMTCDGMKEPTDIEDGPNLATGPWVSGKKLPIPIQEPLEYTLDPDYPGEMMPYYLHEIPIIRQDLFDSLIKAGVLNLETFKAVVKDTETDKDHQNYHAFNIIGLVPATDMNNSILMEKDIPLKQYPMFESLAIDEDKADKANLLLFRLKENVLAIIVHDQVKRQIEQDKIPGITFYDPKDWRG